MLALIYYVLVWLIGVGNDIITGSNMADHGLLLSVYKSTKL